MKKEDLLISIIIPYYKTYEETEKLMKVLIPQLTNEVEVFLIDDGCHDERLDKYNINVIHLEENRGLSYARNVGINQAKGDWLYFCDADDELLPDGLETLIRVSSESIGELVFCGYVECNEDGEVVASPRYEIHKNFSVKETVKQLYRPSYSNYEGYLWCKLFRADFVKTHHLGFAEDVFFNEDRLFVIQCLRHISHDVVYASVPVYRYYHHPQSAYWSLQRQWNPRYVTDLRAYVMMYEEVCEMTTESRIRLMAQEGIRSSIKTIRRMLKRNHVKDTLVENEVVRIEKLYLAPWDKIRLCFMRRARKLEILLHIS